MKLEILEIYEDSKNYTCQVIQLPPVQKVKGLDNLVKVTYQGNDCLIDINYNPNELYLFFPAECQIDYKFLSANNLYRHSELNQDKTQKGFFEDNGRVKTLKFKGIISTGFIIPICSLSYIKGGWNSPVGSLLNIGDEFNEFLGINICSKYYKKQPGIPQPKKKRKIEDFIDGRMAPQHFDTEHLLKNCHKIDLNDHIAITYKLHGTSARYQNTLVKRKISLLERLCKFFGAKIQTEEYKLVIGSRKVIKSVDLKSLDNKNHWYESGDIWTKVGEEYFKDKLNRGEAVYCEIIGRAYPTNNGETGFSYREYEGEAIQQGYTYRLKEPEVYVYRISNINSQGIEVDLPYLQMKQRAKQLDLECCPEYFYGKLNDFFFIFNFKQNLEERKVDLISDIFYNQLLEKPSILDKSVVEEGFCVRVDKYPKPDIYKIKSKKFLEFETKQLDKEITDIEID